MTAERRFMAALEVEIESRLPADWRPRTVYLGGGTPAELTTEGVARLVAILGPWVEEATELTVEANPRTLLERKLRALREGLGINRLSLGAQSFSPRLLKTLGRFHRPADVDAAIEIARSLGIENINIDLIFAVPGQSVAELEADLSRTIALAPDHVSVYCLTIEAGTSFARLRAQGRLRPQDERSQAHLYALVRRRLREAGYGHYEISSFARPGRRCLHNRMYWRNAPYYGVGNGAASHLGGVRSTNHRDVLAYVEAVEAGGGQAAMAEHESLAWERKVRETAYLALRTSEGIVPSRFRRDTGADPHDFFSAELSRLGELGLVEEKSGRLVLSGRGVSLADAVAVEIL